MSVKNDNIKLFPPVPGGPDGGITFCSDGSFRDGDPMMATGKREGWISLTYCPAEAEATGRYIPFCHEHIFPTEEDARNAVANRECREVLKTIKIGWEE